MSDNYNREDLDEEVNKVMEDNTEQDLSTVNDSELTTDTEADNNKGEKEKAAKNKKEPEQRTECRWRCQAPWSQTPWGW